jgi:hypothetical protein
VRSPLALAMPASRRSAQVADGPSTGKLGEIPAQSQLDRGRTATIERGCCCPRVRSACQYRGGGCCAAAVGAPQGRTTSRQTPRQSVEATSSSTSPKRSASVPHEVDACASAFRSAFVGARDAAQRAASALSGDSAVRPYRAFWLLSGRRVVVRRRRHRSERGHKTAVGLLKEAHDAAQGQHGCTGEQTTTDPVAAGMLDGTARSLTVPVSDHLWGYREPAFLTLSHHSDMDGGRAFGA